MLKTLSGFVTPQLSLDPTLSASFGRDLDSAVFIEPQPGLFAEQPNVIAGDNLEDEPMHPGAQTVLLDKPELRLQSSITVRTEQTLLATPVAPKQRLTPCNTSLKIDDEANYAGIKWKVTGIHRDKEDAIELVTLYDAARNFEIPVFAFDFQNVTVAREAHEDTQARSSNFKFVSQFWNSENGFAPSQANKIEDYQGLRDGLFGALSISFGEERRAAISYKEGKLTILNISEEPLYVDPTFDVPTGDAIRQHAIFNRKLQPGENCVLSDFNPYPLQSLKFLIPGFVHDVTLREARPVAENKLPANARLPVLQAGSVPKISRITKYVEPRLVRANHWEPVRIDLEKIVKSKDLFFALEDAPSGILIVQPRELVRLMSGEIASITFGVKKTGFEGAWARWAKRTRPNIIHYSLTYDKASDAFTLFNHQGNTAEVTMPYGGFPDSRVRPENLERGDAYIFTNDLEGHFKLCKFDGSDVVVDLELKNARRLLSTQGHRK